MNIDDYEAKRAAKELNEWKARAEAAEAELAKYQNRSHQDMIEMLDERNAALERARTEGERGDTMHRSVVYWRDKAQDADERARAAEADADRLWKHRHHLLGCDARKLKRNCTCGLDAVEAQHREAVAARPKEAGE